MSRRYSGPMLTPSLSALRAFEAAARLGSFRGAADELAVTQSAVSHQVAELERRLGVALFVRRSRGVELTPAGERYHPYVAEAFARIEQGTALVARTPASPAELDLQVYVTVAVRWLIPRLHSFGAAHPDVLVRLSTSQRDWEFDERSGDVGIICTEHPDRPALHYVHLFDARLVVVGSPALARAGMGLRQPAELVNHSLLQLFTAPEEWDAWWAAAALPPDHMRGGARFDSYLLAIEAATEGQGVALVPEFLVASDLRSGRLVAPFAVTVPQPRRWYFVVRRDRRDRPAVQHFEAWLRAEVAHDATLAAARAGRPADGIAG
jgi:LysR family transcriptional regulator, glycine cleavage system transcriptional activator